MHPVIPGLANTLRQQGDICSIRHGFGITVFPSNELALFVNGSKTLIRSVVSDISINLTCMTGAPRYKTEEWYTYRLENVFYIRGSPIFPRQEFNMKIKIKVSMCQTSNKTHAFKIRSRSPEC